MLRWAKLFPAAIPPRAQVQCRALQEDVRSIYSCPGRMVQRLDSILTVGKVYRLREVAERVCWHRRRGAGPHLRLQGAAASVRILPAVLPQDGQGMSLQANHHLHASVRPTFASPALTNHQQDGRPVYIEQLGNVDLTALGKITSQERMIQNLVCEYEKMADPRLPACSRKSGYLLETSCTIMDLKGVGIAKATSVYGYLGAVSAISQNYYPERLGKMYIINAPWGFSGVFSVVKKFLDPVTSAKIHVLGSGYQTELLAQIPAENLPKSLGGQCECEKGCQLSDAGPWWDPQWAKEPKWATKSDDDAIDNTQLPPPTQSVAPAAPVGADPPAVPAPVSQAQPQPQV